MRYRALLFALICLSASAPPALFGYWDLAGLLVLPGWMAFYAMSQGAKRPLLQAWLCGTLHVLLFSLSLFHKFWGIVPAIAAVCGLYYLLATWWTRRASRLLPGPFAFGFALAACSWLRAHMWEIPHPHAQPAHSLYLWPELLGSVRWGGETLANFLLGFAAASLVDLYRAWRVGKPAFRGALYYVIALPLVWLCFSFWPYGGFETQGRNVDVAMVEPRMGPNPKADFESEREYYAWIRKHVGEPSVAIAGPGVADAPDLLVWPESVAIHGMLSGKLDWIDGPPLRLARDCRLLAGGPNEVWRRKQDDGTWEFVRHWASAVLTDARGAYVDHYEKQWLVPGGESQPAFMFWLVPIVEWFMGMALPVTDRGRKEHGHPLELADGTPFGVLICFDNAFPGPAMSHREAGARFLVVVSNETWYLGGAELDQMAAMAVFRALETGLVVLRCTVDGLTMKVDADGRIRESLGHRPDLRNQPEVLRLQVALGPQGKPPLAWLHRWLPWLWLASALLLLPSPGASWGRLLRRPG